MVLVKIISSLADLLLLMTKGKRILKQRRSRLNMHLVVLNRNSPFYYVKNNEQTSKSEET